MLYAQLDLGIADTGLEDTVDVACLCSQSVALRGGYIGRSFSAGIFYAMLESVHDNGRSDTSERGFLRDGRNLHIPV